MEKLASPRDAWALLAPTIRQSADITLHNRQSAINMPTNGSSAINMPYHGQSAINMLGDLVIPTLGNLMIPTRQSTINTLRDLVIPTLGDPAIPNGWSTITMLRDLVIPTPDVLPACLPVPKAWPPLLLHSGPIAHVNVFVDNFIGIAHGSPTLCQHIYCCILHAINCIFTQAMMMPPIGKQPCPKRRCSKGMEVGHNAKKSWAGSLT